MEKNRRMKRFEPNKEKLEVDISVKNITVFFLYQVNKSSASEFEAKKESV